MLSCGQRTSQTEALQPSLLSMRCLEQVSTCVPLLRAHNRKFGTKCAQRVSVIFVSWRLWSLSAWLSESVRVVGSDSSERLSPTTRISPFRRDKSTFALPHDMVGLGGFENRVFCQSLNMALRHCYPARDIFSFRETVDMKWHGHNVLWYFFSVLKWERREWKSSNWKHCLSSKQCLSLSAWMTAYLMKPQR